MSLETGLDAATRIGLNAEQARLRGKLARRCAGIGRVDVTAVEAVLWSAGEGAATQAQRPQDLLTPGLSRIVIALGAPLKYRIVA
ncbi:hypothetical protein Vau01_015910 [Virgisporangium aurantiacum]|uniref:Uncharacterized protein n=1 Tax=Virgisporangium aurantiacum TaxID=175570 RepID=A0A8J3Z2E5_9ACTN|nr:hypothetical protein Vau01_015910 [Virgisporangium aurantiacum]